MKANYILLLALLGVSALSMVCATGGKFDGRPTVEIQTNSSGIVTLSAVNTALNQTWRHIQRTWSHKNTPRPTMPALASFQDVDAVWKSIKKGISVTLLGPDAFQVTRTRWTPFNPTVEYLASTTNATTVTGLIHVILPKRSWMNVAEEDDDEGLETATFGHNKPSPKPSHNFTHPTKPTKPTPQPKPFYSKVIRRIPRTSNTTTITVADINGPASGNVKVATFFVRPNLATLTSVAVSKWSWATVGFNATVSNTSFTITLNNNKILNWVDVAVIGVSKTNTTTQGTVSVTIRR